MTEAQNSFNAMIHELENSKLITAGKSVSSLLKCLAYFPELRRVVEACTKNFDYDRAFSRAVVNFGTHNAFRLPENPRKKVALVVCLLSEFDLMKRDFTKFVFDFFPSEHRPDSYPQFFKGVIEPFAVAFNSVLEGKDLAADKTRASDEKVSAVSDSISEQANFTVLRLVDLVKGASLEEAERLECHTVIEGFALAVDMRDTMLLKVCWIGLKNTLARYRVGVRELKELEELLKQFAVL